MLYVMKLLTVVMIAAGLAIPGIAREDLFRIDVRDRENGWPVPLVEMRTTHEMRFISDNAGVIALDAPELMGRECWFHVEGHGYTVPADGFGYQGVRITPEPGGSYTLKVSRSMPARRLGRITGAGLFAESQRFGLHQDWLESGVFGCDSVQVARYQGKLFWAWGDTTLPHYPLGVFHASSATTPVMPLANPQPPIRLEFVYFRDGAGRIRSVAQMAGEGPTWLSGYVNLPDSAGNQRLVANYVKVKNFLDVYESGLCVWNDEAEKFDHYRTLWTKSDDELKPSPVPDGHPAFWTDPADGKSWLLFGDPFPRLKMAPDFESWGNPSVWEVIEPQKAVPSRDTGELVVPHRGSIVMSPWLRKWVAIFTQLNGKPSSLGEIWFAVSDSPMGPWSDAVKVVTHSDYTFYNPRIHSDLSDPSGPILLFEATYTRQFARNPSITARYDYNQVLYRLDLDEIMKGRANPQ